MEDGRRDEENNGRPGHSRGRYVRARARATLPCRGRLRGVPGRGGVEAARAALEAFPGIVVMDDCATNTYPMPGLLAGTNETYVGRLRRDDTVDHGLAMWVVADQIRKGAALNAVQIAQLLLP